MGYRLLIVDDSATTRAVIKRTIGLCGIEAEKVIEAGNGKDALAMLAVFGYVAGVEQSGRTLDGLHATMTIVPGVIGALAAIPLIWYRLDERRHAELVRELELA